MRKSSALLIGACLLASGCDSPTEAPAPKTEEPRPTPSGTQTNALEKAKQLEGQMQQDAEARKQQMEQATQ
ncbi:MAG: hypothetical protein HXY27_04465 [Hydrogenophilaceae bacterium]|nr:hypothetical protein [Hydrogenophilaceae bacterium]